ncbi:MAG: hypothetical protein ACRD01_14475 [Terriglobales bacterium]
MAAKFSCTRPTTRAATPAWRAYMQSFHTSPIELAALARKAHPKLLNPVGAVTRLSCVRGNAVLAAAAERAVSQWRYRRLRLDGRAVPVATVITLRFTLH